MIVRSCCRMSNNIITCFYTEGATDEVFYDKLRQHLRKYSTSKKFYVSKVEKSNIQGIGNFQSKLLRKFKAEILPLKKDKADEIVVFLCYDKDVFELVSKTPPVDREKLEQDLLEAGANKVIHIVANKSIEDIFLTDIDSILTFLKLKKSDASSLSGNGYEKLKKLYKKANKIYQKGENVEGFVEKLDMDLICSIHCKMFSPICNILFNDFKCINKK